MMWPRFTAILVYCIRIDDDGASRERFDRSPFGSERPVELKSHVPMACNRGTCHGCATSFRALLILHIYSQDTHEIIYETERRGMPSRLCSSIKVCVYVQ